MCACPVYTNETYKTSKKPLLEPESSQRTLACPPLNSNPNQLLLHQHHTSLERLKHGRQLAPHNGQAPRPERNRSAGCLLPAFSGAIVCWLLIGSISYSPVARASLGDAFIALAVFLIFFQAVLLLIACTEVGMLWPGRASPTLTAGTAGFAAAMPGAIWAAESWAHWGQGLFWALGGIYGGVALEVVTGFWSRVTRRLERSARSG
ncbi:uncharacterized protein ColSpa_02155 [Colletotrichum spaethianum]|uniref:Uncharacterized protein n=1 Tax=Colletotrichum spaethianum TaxID=700344 RepID=A0AA37P744_9PEZI|nr:uncharacterized protein ColSpa_02155 [Colletotrichum spaethianum]GKT41974.1 hypothetical protein ColSpa_02155 [Colletotrichum spaethianum]